jgi:hypothetical protein
MRSIERDLIRNSKSAQSARTGAIQMENGAKPKLAMPPINSGKTTLLSILKLAPAQRCK